MMDSSALMAESEAGTECPIPPTTPEEANDILASVGLPPQPLPPPEIARGIVEKWSYDQAEGFLGLEELIIAAIQSERDGQAKRILAAVEVSKEASDEWEVVLQKRIEELKRQLATETTAYEGIAEKYVKIMDDLSPSPCGVKGHRKVDWTDWTEGRAGERRGNAVPGIEDRRKYGSGGSWLERRITNSGGHCARCGEAEEAKLEAIRHVATGCGLACRPRSNLDDLVTAIKQETGRAVTEALEECCMALCTHCHCLCCGPEPGNAEVKPAVLIEGGWWHPVIWLPSGGADRVRCGAAAIRDSVQSLRKWHACRITDSGGYCGEGERIEKAVTDALEAAVVRFEFVALEYCERWKVMPKQFIDKGTAAIRGKAVKG
jgi:hypothetical protein